MSSVQTVQQRRLQAHVCDTTLIVVLLWRWFLWTAPEQAAIHYHIIDQENLWDACLVPGIPILALVTTSTFERVLHTDAVSAPMFGVRLRLTPPVRCCTPS